MKERMLILFSDTIDPVKRNSGVELFLIRIEGIPKSDNPESAEFAGAFINAWVNKDTLREAEQVAIDRIEEEGWRPVRFDHWELVCRDCYSESTHKEDELQDIMECINNAFEFGIGLEFHTWPIQESAEQ